MKLRKDCGSPGRAATLMEFIVVVAFALLVAVTFLFLSQRARPRSSRLGCVNWMKQIGLAFRMWELDNNGRFPTSVSLTDGGAMEPSAAGDVALIFQVMSNELSTPKILVCPNDAKRTAATNFLSLRNTNLSYFVNLDARNTNQGQVLAGDYNLTNQRIANSGFVDVNPTTTLGWDKFLHRGHGNLAQTDGSVDFYPNGKSRVFSDTNAGAVNRLATP